MIEIEDATVYPDILVRRPILLIEDLIRIDHHLLHRILLEIAAHSVTRVELASDAFGRCQICHAVLLHLNIIKYLECQL